MKMQDHVKKTNTQKPLAAQVLICLGGLCVMGALMYYSFTYPYPNEKPLGLLSFVMFCLREIAMLLFAVVVLILIVAGWAVQWVRRVGKAGKNATHSTMR